MPGSNSVYDTLPKNIKEKLSIKYSQLMGDDLVIFRKTNDLWGVLKYSNQSIGILKPFDILVEPKYDSAGYDNNLKVLTMVEYNDGKFCKDKNTFYFFTNDGELINKVSNVTNISIDKFGVIVVKRNDMTGLLNEKFEVMIEPTYQTLLPLENGIYKARKNEKWGIIDSDNRVLMEFTNSSIINYSKDNKIIIEIKPQQYIVFDYKTQVSKDLPYNMVLEAESNTYRAPGVENRDKLKTITNLTTTEFVESEMSEYTGKWGIMDASSEIIIPNEYAYVDFFRDPFYFKAATGKFEFDNDEDTFNVIAKRNAKWGVIDKSNNIIIPMEFDWIEEISTNLWSVNVGGTVYCDSDEKNKWSVRGGKWGVFNNHPKIIVPVTYDAIKTNWYKVKDYLFVQNDTKYFDDSLPYYVYTFEGKRIRWFKPNARKHTFYE